MTFSSYLMHVRTDRAKHLLRSYGLKLDEVAARCGYRDTAYFCRVFKRATGLSPHQYVMKARLERAQQMLGGTELSIAQVADSLGFGSQSHFTRAFRSFTGQTPSSWRMANFH